MSRFPPISPKFNKMLHGADYNPDQWLASSDVISEDYRLMRLAGCNVMSVGIFAWSALEPEPGQFNFGWLDEIIDGLWDNGIYTILATPSAARPAWLSSQYPEVLRVNEDRRRILHSGRHNHCFTSPVYRRLTARINEQLALRYGSHPGLLLWHISNEYGGACHCPLCQDAFRDFLRQRYDNDLTQLNQAWWTAFWSHTYTDWSQIESPAPHGENGVHALYLDWKRFTTEQTRSFMASECRPLRRICPDIPITTNFMETFPDLDYFKMAQDVDIISWDSYPAWHSDLQSPQLVAASTAFSHDLFRSLKRGQPFLLMESTPSQVNWQAVCKLKKPGMHRLSAIQAIAHGSDSIQYFQWRKSRGSSEKLHGAVVDHVGHEHTRVFRDVTEVGQMLQQLTEICGTSVPARTAVYFDWENRWALEHLQGLTKEHRDYLETCKSHHLAFWRQGIAVDIVDMDSDISSYRLLVAPMLYMVRPGLSTRLQDYVRNGGVLVLTYFSGLADQNDLCFLNGFPGPLRQMAGIWAEETDSLYPSEQNSLIMNDNTALDLSGSYMVHTLCDLIHAESAQVLAVYGSDFYKGRPALTVNQYGKGKVYYLAARTEQRFLDTFYRSLAASAGVKPALPELPEDVTVSCRTDGQKEYLFIQNFASECRQVNLAGRSGIDLLKRKRIGGSILLEPYGAVVMAETSTPEKR